MSIVVTTSGKRTYPSGWLHVPGRSDYLGPVETAGVRIERQHDSSFAVLWTHGDTFRSPCRCIRIRERYNRFQCRGVRPSLRKVGEGCVGQGCCYVTYSGFSSSTSRTSYLRMQQGKKRFMSSCQVLPMGAYLCLSVLIHLVMTASIQSL